MATPNSRQQKKQKMYQLQREVEELRKQVEQQKNDDALQKVRVNISITKETKQRLKNYADYKNISVSQAISDWIWSTRFDKWNDILSLFFGLEQNFFCFFENL